MASGLEAVTKHRREHELPFGVRIAPEPGILTHVSPYQPHDDTAAEVCFCPLLLKLGKPRLP